MTKPKTYTGLKDKAPRPFGNAVMPSSDEVLQVFNQGEEALLRMAPSGEDPNAEEVYSCLEVMRDYLLGAIRNNSIPL